MGEKATVKLIKEFISPPPLIVLKHNIGISYSQRYGIFREEIFLFEYQQYDIELSKY